MPSGFKSVRDILMFCIGTIGLAYEALAQNGERINLIILYGALLGLPYVLKSDEKRAEDKPPETKQEAKK